jgi:putative serine/threonine protein kinase
LGELLPLEEVKLEHHGLLLCYPAPERKEFEKRLRELEKLGIRCLELAGSKRVHPFSILGKGYSSLVVAAVRRDGLRCALKIRRLDSGKPDLGHEATMHSAANRVGVGPRLYGFTENILSMELVEGVHLPEWLTAVEEKGKRDAVKKVLKETLTQCRSLDKAGLDHGELSLASKHILISREDRPYLIDFEKSSLRRRPANVTALCHFLFLGGATAERIAALMGRISREALRELLRRYKAELDDGAFEKLLSALFPRSVFS